MNEKIHVLKVQKKEDGVSILIDNVPLLKILEESIPDKNFQWKEKSRVTVNEAVLKESCVSPGDFPILVCSNCLADGHDIPEDVSLRPISVTHDNEYVTWKITPPGSGLQYEADEGQGLLIFKFHKPQYVQAVS